MNTKQTLMVDLTGKYCNQCNAGLINGLFCHETGCPNADKTFKDGRWQDVFTCPYCGYDRLEDEPECDCSESIERIDNIIKNMG